MFSLLLLTATAWLVSVWMFSNALESRLEAQLSHTGRVLADQGIPLTSEVMLQLQRLLKADIVLIDCCGGQGPSTLQADQSDLFRASLEQYAQWQQAKPLEQATTLRLENAGQFYTLALHVIPKERDPRFKAVVIIGSLSDIQRAAHDAALTTGGFTVLGMLLFSWIVHRIASGITRPVAELACMARRITEGDREIRVRIDRDDEIGGLAIALNAMAEEIANYETTLEQSSRLSALGQMSARIAHEVRNPLTAIKLHLQILQESSTGEGAVIVNTLLDEVQRLELIVSGILEVGHPIRLNAEPADLNTLIQEIARLFEAQLQHKRICLETDLAADLPKANLDKARIKQVLLNLLTNACDELPTGGRIAINTSQDVGMGQILLSVEDSGGGIPLESRERVFNARNSSKAGGFGLGLSLSKELAELHNGRIEVGSSRLGGARFTIYLPAGIDSHG